MRHIFRNAKIMTHNTHTYILPSFLFDACAYWRHVELLDDLMTSYASSLNLTRFLIVGYYNLIVCDNDIPQIFQTFL